MVLVLHAKSSTDRRLLPVEKNINDIRFDIILMALVCEYKREGHCWLHGEGALIVLWTTGQLILMIISPPVVQHTC